MKKYYYYLKSLLFPPCLSTVMRHYYSGIAYFNKSGHLISISKYKIVQDPNSLCHFKYFGSHKYVITDKYSNLLNVLEHNKELLSLVKCTIGVTSTWDSFGRFTSLNTNDFILELRSDNSVYADNQYVGKLNIDYYGELYETRYRSTGME